MLGPGIVQPDLLSEEAIVELRYTINLCSPLLVQCDRFKTFSELLF